MDNNQNTNAFEVMLSALEARRTQLIAQVNAEIDADIATIRDIAERNTGSALGLANPVANPIPTQIEKDTFFNLTLPEAAKKYLTMCGKKTQTTNAIIDALEKGGLKRTSYASMYTSLSRRENNVGDIVNVNGDWGLPEWYGAKPKPKAKKIPPNAPEINGVKAPEGERQDEESVNKAS